MLIEINRSLIFYSKILMILLFILLFISVNYYLKNYIKKENLRKVKDEFLQEILKIKASKVSLEQFKNLVFKKGLAQAYTEL